VGSDVGLDRLSGKADKLNTMQVKKLSSLGRYADGNCLYLTVSESGSRSWLLRIVVRGRRRYMGLGSFGQSCAVGTILPYFLEFQSLLPVSRSK